MTQYLLSVIHPEMTEADMPSPEVMQEMYGAVDVFNASLMSAGAFVFGGGLMPPSSATVVRVVDGESLITDGPFTETKEQLGGFWVIEAADLDVALDWAKRGAGACQQPVEVRAFQGEPEA
jgi:hypothetical protein